VKVLHDPPEVVQKGVHVGSDADALALFVAERFLQQAEEATKAWDGQDHAAQFPQELLPAFGGDAGFAVRELREDVHESLEAAWRQFDGVADTVKNPTKNRLAGAPGSISL
jgi:hypothetical protein